MNNLPELLEQELEEAVEVKSKKSLHRYIILLTDNIIKKSTYQQNTDELRTEIKVLAETMKVGFQAMDRRLEAIDKRFEAVDKRFETVDKRFEAVDKRFEDLYRYMDKRFEDMNHRFEDMNKRFNMMFTFMSVGFSIIILLTVLFKFIQ